MLFASVVLLFFGKILVIYDQGGFCADGKKTYICKKKWQWNRDVFS